MNKKRKKILLYTRPLAPPWDEASKNLAFEIACSASGPFEFHALTTKNFSREFLKVAGNQDGKKVVAEKIYESAKFENKDRLRLLLRLFRPKLDADIVHFLFTPRLLTSQLAKTRLSFSKVRSIQTVASISQQLHGNYSLLRKVLFADQIVAQSAYTKKKLELAGFEHVRLVYPGLDRGKFAPGPKNIMMIKELGISEGDFVVLFAGEYSRLSAVDDIVQVMELLNEETGGSVNYKFIFACRIKSDDDLAKKHQTIDLLEKKGLAGNAIFIDHCKDMQSLYRISDANIFPARRMAGKVDIPFVIIEAMLCQKPVIISDIPVLEEFVENEKTGLVVRKANPGHLARAIKRLAQDSQLAQKIGQNALNYAIRNFDITKNVKSYEEIYDCL